MCARRSVWGPGYTYGSLAMERLALNVGSLLLFPFSRWMSEGSGSEVAEIGFLVIGLCEGGKGVYILVTRVAFSLGSLYHLKLELSYSKKNPSLISQYQERKKEIAMSHLRYYAYDGVGKRNLEKYYYSQAVRIDNRIECAGQGNYPPPPLPSFLSSNMRTFSRRLGSQNRRTRIDN